MTRAVLLAGLAGGLAALAVADLAVAVRRRERAGRRRGDVALALVLRLGRRVGVGPAPRDLRARLAAAGDPFGLAPRDLMAAKAGAALLALLAVAPLAAAAPGRLGLLLAGAAPVAGYLAPDVLLRRRSARRAVVLQRDLPDVLDLLRVAVQAGLPVHRAMAEVGSRHTGALAAELGRAAAQVRLGVSSRDAFERLRERAPLPGVAALLGAVDRAQRHGAPLAGTLEAIARDARADAARALQEHAARAAPKIQLAVALLLVPAAMLVVGAGLLHALGLA